MEHLPIEWEDKINSPELLAFLQQYGQEHYLSAEEINQIRDALNELSTGISSSAFITEYANLFTYTTGAQTLTVPTTLKAMSVTLNDGRVLKKTIDWERTSTTVITILYALEENDTIYITGLI
jgi:hypothetical protein